MKEKARNITTKDKKKKNVMLEYIKKHYFTLIIVLYSFYSLLLVYKSSFVIDNIRYFSLFDDMMISMRYAYNLAHGHGLVWNVGMERVEGFSNPLWTLYMSFIHLFPLPIEKTSLVVQLTGLVLMVTTLYFVQKITAILTKNSWYACVIALVFSAFYFPLNNWSVIQGTEVSLLTLLLTASVYLLITAIEKRKFSILLFILLGIGTFVRVDFVVPAVVIIIMYFIFNTTSRKKIFAFGIPLFLLFLFTQIGLRYFYFHEIFPNTYYLKMTGVPILYRVIRGIYVTIQEINPILVAILFLFTALIKNKYTLILLICFAMQLLYSMYVGGDAWESYGGANRYVSISMPLVFIILAQIVYKVRTFVSKNQYTQYLRLEFLSLVFLFIICNSGSDNMLLYLTTIKSVPTIDGNAFHVQMSQRLNTITNTNAKIGIVQAGVVPYFSIDRHFVDLLGKSEKVIARTPSHLDTSSGNLRKYLSYWPGHTKWNYQYIVQEVKPDIFGQVFPLSEIVYMERDYKRYLSKEGYEFYIAKNSTNLNIK